MSQEKKTIGAKVSPNLEERIEQYQDTEGFANKSDAVRDLIETGLNEKENPSGNLPLPAVVMWFGSLLFMIPVEVGPGTSPELIAATGAVVFLAGALLARTESPFQILQ